MTQSTVAVSNALFDKAVHDGPEEDFLIVLVLRMFAANSLDINPTKQTLRGCSFSAATGKMEFQSDEARP